MSESAEIAILAPGIITESRLPPRWKRRGSFTDLAEVQQQALLARAFGIPYEHLPEASLHYLGVTGNDPGGYCLFAWPVHLHARREQLILMTGPEFLPDEAESEQLVSLISGHFPHWRVERDAKAPWFIIVEDEPDLETTPLPVVVGEDINDHLPRGRDGMKWTGYLNEIQMLLFDSEVNEKREAQGTPPLNSLWIWGGGRLPQTIATRWRRVVTSDPVAQGIARLAGIDSGSPAAVRDDIQSIGAGGTLLILARPTAAEEKSNILSKAHWDTMRAMLRRKDIQRLVLIEPGHGELVLDAGQATGWWPW